MRQLLIVLLFTAGPFLHSESARKCEFLDAFAEFQTGVTRTRPTTDTFSPSPSGHFYIHYDTTGTDAPQLTDIDLDGVPDYIEEVGLIADSSRYFLTEILGYNAEVPDTDFIYDIYVSDRGPGSYGVTTPEDMNGASYIQIDNDYLEGYFVPGLQTMQLTVAHEFFHAVQIGYTMSISANRFFYEMSSTWLEDVIVPDGDDYIYWVGEFYENPSQDITDTNGYSIALFGHYLSLVAENVDNQSTSEIIRLMWESFAQPGNTAFESMCTVLDEDYNISFIEIWTDYIACNLFNGFDESFYFYEDQAIIEPINPASSLLTGPEIFQMELENSRAEIISVRLSDLETTHCNLDILHDHPDFTGKIGIVSGNSDSNFILIPVETMSIDMLHDQDKLHFIYGSPQGNEDLSLSLSPDFFNLPPDPNGDGSWDVLDIVLTVNFIVGTAIPDDDQFEAADINDDGTINILDVVIMINLIIAL